MGPPWRGDDAARLPEESLFAARVSPRTLGPVSCREIAETMGQSMQDEARRIQAGIEKLVAEGAGPERIADAAVSTWQSVHASLAPVIGPRGVSALYVRSLHLACEAHPWLATVRQATVAPGDFVSLRCALAQQPDGTAAAANGELLQRFQAMLTNLIGSSLSARLLGAVAAAPAAARDPGAPAASVHGS